MKYLSTHISDNFNGMKIAHKLTESSTKNSHIPVQHKNNIR